MTGLCNKVTAVEIMSNNLKSSLKKEGSIKEGKRMMQFLLQYLKNAKLSHDATNAAEIEFNVHRRIIYRL